MSGANDGFVTFDEISKDMTESDYLAFVDRERKRNYFNDAKKDADGSPIDGGVYILEGMRLLNEAVSRE